MKKLLTRIIVLIAGAALACSCDLNMVDTYTFNLGVQYGIYDSEGKAQESPALEDYFQRTVDIKGFEFKHYGPQVEAMDKALIKFDEAYRKLDKSIILSMLPGKNDHARFFMHMSSESKKGSSGILYEASWSHDSTEQQPESTTN